MSLAILCLVSSAFAAETAPDMISTGTGITHNIKANSYTRFAQGSRGQCVPCHNRCAGQGFKWIADCSQFRGQYNDQCIRQARQNEALCHDQCNATYC
jgi:hypothetical protein